MSIVENILLLEVMKRLISKYMTVNQSRMQMSVKMGCMFSVTRSVEMR